ncbi:MAG: DUF308 domain-containing protein [Clostridia bacterium]|nr:DUF308 domain-containing protein [Clostridia bacterium]
MIRSIVRNKTVLAILSIVMGIYMCVAGRNVLYSIIRVAGYGLIGAAIIYLVLYLTGQNGRDQVKMGYAIVSGIAGLLIVRLAPAIVNLFPILAGVGLILAGIGNLTQAAGSGMPMVSKVGPIVTLVLGLLILTHPGTVVNMVVTLAGIALILNGLSELEMIRRVW